MKNFTVIAISARAGGEKLEPYWKRLICAGRAAEGLRDHWRRQLEEVQREIGFSHIRFHGLFHEDMMVIRKSDDGRIIYNWHYVDDLFDFLLSIGLKPFMELGFMPSLLASGDATCFWWRGNITPPADYSIWADLINAFLSHILERYGREEIRGWYFEVWNEPNLYEYFWRAGQEEYFLLYKITAETIKDFDPHLKVGGPATSNFSSGEGPWIRDFIRYCDDEEVPWDFISSHPYPNHWPEDPDTGKRRVAFRGANALAEDTGWLKKQVSGSKNPRAEIHLTEWNSSFLPWDRVHDTPFMAPFIVQNALNSAGNVDSLGFWTFTDIFEETGAGELPFHGGFGMISYRGIKKPAYHAFAFLSRLGEELLDRGESWIVTRNGSPESREYRILLWNYLHYNPEYRVGGKDDPVDRDPYGAFPSGGKVRHFAVNLQGFGPLLPSFILLRKLSRDCGSALDSWIAMGRPEYPSLEEYRLLEELSRPCLQLLPVNPDDPVVRIEDVEPHSLILLEFSEKSTSSYAASGTVDVQKGARDE